MMLRKLQRFQICALCLALCCLLSGLAMIIAGSAAYSKYKASDEAKNYMDAVDKWEESKSGEKMSNTAGVSDAASGSVPLVGVTEKIKLENAPRAVTNEDKYSNTMTSYLSSGAGMVKVPSANAGVVGVVLNWKNGGTATHPLNLKLPALSSQGGAQFADTVCVTMKWQGPYTNPPGPAPTGWTTGEPCGATYRAMTPADFVSNGFKLTVRTEDDPYFVSGDLQSNEGGYMSSGLIVLGVLLGLGLLFCLIGLISLCCVLCCYCRHHKGAKGTGQTDGFKYDRSLDRAPDAPPAVNPAYTQSYMSQSGPMSQSGYGSSVVSSRI